MEPNSTRRRSLDSDLPTHCADAGRPAKKQRLFVSRQACESCRQKKRKCDEGYPCASCKAAGEECSFTERKATKNEVSLGMIFNVLQRIEGSIEGVKIETASAKTITSAPRRASVALSNGSPASSEAYNGANRSNSYERSGALHDTPIQVCYSTIIPYDTHRFLSWPAIKSKLEEFPKLQHLASEQSYATRLELSRPAMSPYVDNATSQVSANRLAQLNTSVIKALTDDYFSTWNLTNPILDRDVFNQHTLSVAVNSDFGHNIETCLLLVVLALGCLGRRALRNGGFHGSSGASSADYYVDDAGAAPSQPSQKLPGQMFFDEARKRMGFMLFDNTMQSCQYYLLSGLYYGEAIRPADWWAMNSRASVCCTLFWESVADPCEDWVLDMQSRLYWITVMFEAVLTQELDLPPSNILDFEDRVPLPRFIKFPSISLSTAFPGAATLTQAEDLSFCHYHFLSQIAHRRILTRVRNSMFSSRRGRLAQRETQAQGSPATLPVAFNADDYPPRALEEELLHQLEQWRQKLPKALQFADKGPSAPATSPEDYFVVPWLRARYLIAKYHLRRPLLHRALHHPQSLTPSDIQKCRDTLSSVMDWTSVIKTTLALGSCSPLRFFSCTQLFGQFLIMYCFKNGSEPMLRDLLPAGYETWCAFARDELKKGALESPVLAQDSEIIEVLAGHVA